MALEQLHYVVVYDEIESLITWLPFRVFTQTKKYCTVNEREITADDKFKDVQRSYVLISKGEQLRLLSTKSAAYDCS